MIKNIQVKNFNSKTFIKNFHYNNKFSADEKGDLLIFLSGMSEINTVVDAAKEYSQKKNNWIILPLHSTLAISEQDKVPFLKYFLKKSNLIILI